MGDGVLVTDSQGGLVLMNPAAKLMLRIAATDDEARTRLAFEELWRRISADTQADRGNPFSRALRGEAVDGAEMFLHHAQAPEGTWLAVTGRPLMDQKGTISGEVIVFSDITARKDLERRIAEVSDREQRRIGEDLHDGLCQQLVGVAFAARRLAARLSDLSLRETEDAAKLAGLLGESIAQARDVARGLYLVQLEADGLNSALEELAMQVRSRHAIACQFIDQSPTVTVDETIATCLFRIAQEAVNNALKHSRAGQITITLATDQGQIRLAIEDDGTGLPADYGSMGGLGLQIMNYRARMIGATLTLRPRPGGGTVVGCMVQPPNLAERTAHVPQN
jgi:signal transduction histidine kinase